MFPTIPKFCYSVCLIVVISVVVVVVVILVVEFVVAMVDMSVILLVVVVVVVVLVHFLKFHKDWSRGWQVMPSFAKGSLQNSNMVKLGKNSQPLLTPPPVEVGNFVKNQKIEKNQ